MFSYCLNCRKNTKNKNPKVVKKQKAEEYCYYQNVSRAIANNQNFSNSKKLVDY